MDKLYHARKSQSSSLLDSLIAAIFGSPKYSLTQTGLVVSRPIFHQHVFRYSDILSAERLSVADAKALASRYPPLNYAGQVMPLDKDLTYLAFYCSAGEILPDYQSPANTVFGDRGDFVLIRANYGEGKGVSFLLSPADTENFLLHLEQMLGDKGARTNSGRSSADA